MQDLIRKSKLTIKTETKVFDFFKICMIFNCIFMDSPFFPAKILLFGEYAIIKNSKGLSIPYNFYKGRFKFNIDSKNINNIYSNNELKNYFNFLKFLMKKINFLTKFRIDDFYQDIKNKMFFDSNIPQGYGVGSSGALVAAIYYKYIQNKNFTNKSLNKKNLFNLKVIFGHMESFFHGKSSGIDPLICYLKLPLLIKSTKNISTINLPKQKKGNGAVFLINSGNPSSTDIMIQIFLEKLKNNNFKKILKEQFIKYNNNCVEIFLKEDFNLLLINVKKISYWVYKHFRPMIPISLLKVWSNGIISNDYYLKLCGSGGGGFILGFSYNYKIAKEKLKNYEPKIVFQF